MARMYYPPDHVTTSSRLSIFLAGSIEMGLAIEWQEQVCKSLQRFSVDIYNPRRPLWDNSLKQEKNCNEFREQVDWELNNLENADIIIMHFDPKTKSPISLLELGLHVRDTGQFGAKLCVSCPEGFYRRGNIQIVCERYNVPLYDDLSELIKNVETLLTTRCIDSLT